ncbi:MAG: hypothetical protein WBO38_11355, partial [Chitinophagaceae bacterium]
MKRISILVILTGFVVPVLSQVKQLPVQKKDEIKVVTTVSQPVGVIAMRGFDFERGKDALADWTKEGTAFNNQPVYGHNVIIRREMDNTYNPFRINISLGGDYWKDLSLPIGHKGNYWIGSYENRSDLTQPFGRTQGNIPTGVLISPEFTITKDYISFLIGGTNDLANAKVELGYEGQGETDTEEKKEKDPFRVIAPVIKTIPVVKQFRATGKGSSVMRRVWWDVKTLKGKKARIKITDNTSTGYINADDFIFQDAAPVDTDIAINSKVNVKQV